MKEWLIESTLRNLASVSLFMNWITISLDSLEFFYVINIWLNSENTNLNEITSLILKDSLFSSTVIINTTNIINKIFNSYMEKSDNIEKETNKKKMGNEMERKGN